MSAPAYPPELLARAQARAVANDRALLDPATLTLERLVCHPDLGAFRPSRAQLALIRAADGNPIDLTAEELAFHFGSTTSDRGMRPTQLIVRTGVRAGKSFLSGMGLLLSVLTADMRGVRPGEHVRAPIVTPSMATSLSTYRHVLGTMQRAPRLAALIVGEPGVESMRIRRPDGNVVWLGLVPAKAGGLGLRSTWLAGLVLDESDFHDDEGAAVDLPQQLDAAGPRTLPGTQTWVPSSPWSEGSPFDEAFKAAWAAQDGRVVAFHSSSRLMNPTLDRAAEDAMRARDPDAASREYDGLPSSASTVRFFSDDAIAKAVATERADVLQVARGYEHYAATDLGFRKNSSALAIARVRPQTDIVELAYHTEERPPKGGALVPSVVCAGFAATLKDYGCTSVRGDLHYAETAREEFGKARIGYVDWIPTQESTAEVFTAMRRLMLEGRLSLPNDAHLLDMLRRTTTRLLPGGKVQVVLPHTGKAHADVLAAVAIAVAKAGEGPVAIAPPQGLRMPQTRWSGMGRGF